MPNRMEITGRALQSGMPGFILGVCHTVHRLFYDPPNSIVELIIVPDLSRVILLQFGFKLLEIFPHGSVLSVNVERQRSKIRDVPPELDLLCFHRCHNQVHLINFVDIYLGFESSDHFKNSTLLLLCTVLSR
jgi:hypothetical protein